MPSHILSHSFQSVTIAEEMSWYVWLALDHSVISSRSLWSLWKSKRAPKKICFIDYTNIFDCVDHNKLWRNLQEMGIPDYLTCFLRNLYAGQEATVRTGYGTTDWSQIGKRVHQGCILTSCLFTLYAEYIMRNAGLDEAQAGIKTAGEISITSDMQMTPPLWHKAKKN